MKMIMIIWCFFGPWSPLDVFLLNFGRLWHPLGRLWSSFGHLWHPLGRLWSSFGRLWGLFGRLCGLLWTPLGRLGTPWAAKGPEAFQKPSRSLRLGRLLVIKMIPNGAQKSIKTMSRKTLKHNCFFINIVLYIKILLIYEKRKTSD